MTEISAVSALSDTDPRRQISLRHWPPTTWTQPPQEEAVSQQLPGLYVERCASVDWKMHSNEHICLISSAGTCQLNAFVN